MDKKEKHWERKGQKEKKKKGKNRGFYLRNFHQKNSTTFITNNFRSYQDKGV